MRRQRHFNPLFAQKPSLCVCSSRIWCEKGPTGLAFLAKTTCFKRIPHSPEVGNVYAFQSFMTTKRNPTLANKETQSLAEPTRYILRNIEERRQRLGRPVICTQRKNDKPATDR